MALSKAKKLVVVESPAKAKTINKILGSEYIVKATVGHIKNLPKSKLGVDIENGFIPQYTVIKGKEKVIKELKDASQKVSAVLLASDPDREGEAIAWHIAEIFSKNNSKSPEISRVIFNEITERAIKEAVSNPLPIDTNKVEAQQARRVLDRLVGYSLSPLLWKKVTKGLSAGRVQSVALRLIVERQGEIDRFVTQEHWGITAEFEGKERLPFKANLVKYRESQLTEKKRDETRFLITNGDDANRILREIKGKGYNLIKVEKKQKSRSPYPPYITSTLQQDASRRLRFSAKQTMATAQQLYEGIEIGNKGPVGLITYMRTDSTRIAPEAATWARHYIEGRFGGAYLPKTQNRFKVKASAQEAHEAIRPTYGEFEPASIKQYLTPNQFKLYNLIWDRFIASQMEKAQMELTSFDISDPDKVALFHATGTIITFNGFFAMYKDEETGDEAILPDLKEGDPLGLNEITTQQHFTQPPPKYTEATLVKALEEEGIGRPSTYASILSTLEERKYVIKEERKYTPSELGVVVNNLLVEKFPGIINKKFTAEMENELDMIAEGSLVWNNCVRSFYDKFTTDLKNASDSLDKLRPADDIPEINCEKCGKPMIAKWSKNGKFLACTGYPDCKNAKSLDKTPDDPALAPKETGENCDKCGSPMVEKKGRFGKFVACSNYPTCKNIKVKTIGIKCPEDGGEIIERRARKGIFYGCKNYPACKFATWYKPVAESCPDCGALFLVEKKSKNEAVTIQCINKGCSYKRTHG